MMREQKNETFDFLRRNHILFTYFTKMVEQYSKVGGAVYKYGWSQLMGGVIYEVSMGSMKRGWSQLMMG